jgi:hypothetical protein
VALATVGVVLVLVLLSWQAGHGPDSAWMGFLSTFVVPYAGWIGIAALAFVIGRYLVRRRKAR